MPPLEYIHAGHGSTEIVFGQCWFPRPRNEGEHQARKSDMIDRETFTFIYILYAVFVKFYALMVYSSGSQPLVHGPLGVGGTMSQGDHEGLKKC